MNIDNSRETVYVHSHHFNLDDIDTFDQKDVPKPESSGDGVGLQELVMKISDILTSPTYNKEKDVEKVRLLMESYDTSLNEWRRYEFWDESKNYTRNLIATDNRTFNLMLLCWNPRKASPIHAHEDANCWMRIVNGSATETRYAWPKNEAEPMQQLCSTVMSAGQCAFMCDNIGLHKIENTSIDHGCVSIHLYSPPFDSCKVFLDPNCGKASKSCMTYYSENGEKTEH